MASERDFLDALENFGDSIENIDNYLLALGSKLVEEMKANAPVDQGDLKNSISAVVQDNSLVISMLTYGVFQNYGVGGTEGGSRFGIVEDVPAGVLPRPTSEPQYKYQTKKYGIPAQNWFDLDTLRNAVFNEIENRLEF